MDSNMAVVRPILVATYGISYFPVSRYSVFYAELRSEGNFQRNTQKKDNPEKPIFHEKKYKSQVTGEKQFMGLNFFRSTFVNFLQI
jgi:hypothetical protein